MERLTTIAEVRARVGAARAAGDRIALVPTLGALHDGHLANVRLAHEHADAVVVSVFVNPTQFDRADDLAAYPRDLEADEAALRDLGDLAPAFVFAPEVAEMYPREPVTSVHVRGVAEVLEGAFRPGHFDGVATVVTKLLSIVQPDVAVFGRKDAQQNHVIASVVRELDLPVEIVLGPTVREPDGLALSSRNRRLDARERRDARAVPLALAAGVTAARADREHGRRPDPVAVRDTVAGTLRDAPGTTVDYVEVLDPERFVPPDAVTRGEAGGHPGPAEHGDEAPDVMLLVAVAVQVGPVRLIDNVLVGDVADEERLLAAVGAAP